MTSFRVAFVSLLISLSLVISLVNALSLPNFFSSNMVLQRAPQSAQIWGWAAAGSIVTLTLDGTAYKTFTDNNGTFIYAFPPHNSSVGNTLVISGDSSSITLSNLAFGDVYICSGQSNMQFSVSLSFDAKTAIPDSINYPLLRFYVVSLKASLTPLNDTKSNMNDSSQWVVSQPKYVGGPDWQYLSAACYYFGRSLYQSLGNSSNTLPIGLIESVWGGTYVEAWTSPAGLAPCGPAHADNAVVPHPSRHIVHKGSDSDLPTPDDKRWAVDSGADPSPNTPSVLYNAMIYPLINMRITGATWYQGEQNANNATNYACRFPAMITDWRNQFQNYNLYFYFVLLAAFKAGNDWPDLREAQLQALKLPYTGVASAQDLGDESSPEGAIHPRNKTIVGQRLSLNAQAQIYGQKIVYTGPTPADITWPLPGTGGIQTVIIRFNSNLPNNQGLQILDTSDCDTCCAKSSAFTITTSSNKTLDAMVTVDASNYLVLASADLGNTTDYVTGIQHNWLDFPECTLYNMYRLPHLPVFVSRV